MGTIRHGFSRTKAFRRETGKRCLLEFRTNEFNSPAVSAGGPVKMESLFKKRSYSIASRRGAPSVLPVSILIDYLTDAFLGRARLSIEKCGFMPTALWLMQSSMFGRVIHL